MATSSRRSYGTVSSSFHRSGRLSNSKSESSPFASSTSYYSASPSSGFFSQRRPTSPTRVRLHAPSPSPSVRFAIDRSRSPSRSIAAPPCNQAVQRSNSKRTCMCSPTTHPGSFRCAFHKNNPVVSNSVSSYSPNRLNMRRSAMTNSLVRINAVEGDLVRRALAALIRPSSHQQRRRSAFQIRLSRLSVMSTAADL